MTKVTEHVFRREAFTIQQMISAHHLDQAHEPNLMVLDVVEGMMYRLSASMWCRDLPPVPVMTAPADWWQAVRQRWMPRWWLTLFPVVLRRMEVRGFHDYPSLAIAMNGEVHTARLRIHVRETTS